MNKTDIEYLDYTWNPLAMRCTPVSEGCANCWHLRFAKRHASNPKFSDECRAAYAGGKPYLRQAELEAPLKLKKPSRIGVQFMGDLFHLYVRYAWISKIWEIMSACQEHTFVVITKRPEKMLTFVNEYKAEMTFYDEQHSNVWLGVTAENQEQADKRIPSLLQIPAAVRFVSVEPMLGPVDLTHWFASEFPTKTDNNGVGYDWFEHGNLIDWVICGGESGPKARSMHPDWPRKLRDDCVEAGVPFFLKQMAINGKMVKLPGLDGQQWREFPNAI